MWWHKYLAQCPTLSRNSVKKHVYRACQGMSLHKAGSRDQDSGNNIIWYTPCPLSPTITYKLLKMGIPTLDNLRFSGIIDCLPIRNLQADDGMCSSLEPQIQDTVAPVSMQIIINRKYFCIKHGQNYLFSAICKASSDNHFAFLHFLFWGMVFCHFLLYTVTNFCP